MQISAITWRLWMIAKITNQQQLNWMSCCYLHRMKSACRKISISAFQRHRITGAKHNKRDVWHKVQHLNMLIAGLWVSPQVKSDWIFFSSLLIFLKKPQTTWEDTSRYHRLSEQETAFASFPQGFVANGVSKIEKKHLWDLCVSFVDVNTFCKDRLSDKIASVSKESDVG